MDLINQVLTEVLGSYKLAFYIAYFFFVLFGVLISLRIASLRRDKHSDSTPFTFSWKFLLQDKLIRLISSMAVVFVFIRLGQEITGMIPTYTGAVGLGLGFDQALLQLEKIQFKARE